MRISGGIAKGRKIKTRRLFSKRSGATTLRPSPTPSRSTYGTYARS